MGCCSWCGLRCLTVLAALLSALLSALLLCPALLQHTVTRERATATTLTTLHSLPGYTDMLDNNTRWVKPV